MKDRVAGVISDDDFPGCDLCVPDYHWLFRCPCGEGSGWDHYFAGKYTAPVEHACRHCERFVVVTQEAFDAWYQAFEAKHGYAPDRQ